MQKQFVKRMASALGCSEKNAKDLVEVFLHNIEQSLLDGESVAFRGFGEFKTVTVNERNGYNPMTKQKVVNPSYSKVTFKPGKLLKENIKAKFSK